MVTKWLQAIPLHRLTATGGATTGTRS